MTAVMATNAKVRAGGLQVQLVETALMCIDRAVNAVELLGDEDVGLAARFGFGAVAVGFLLEGLEGVAQIFDDGANVVALGFGGGVVVVVHGSDYP